MKKIEFTHDEVQCIQTMLSDLGSTYCSADDQGFLDLAPLLGHELPRRVRQALHEFKLHEAASGMLLFSGFPISGEKIGPTPDHWKNRPEKTPTREADMLLVLLGSLLGEPIGWATQQGGYIVHDISPIEGNEKEQLGSGSEQLLWWHNEDAFHPFRGDYLGMLCLRNHDSVATTFANLDGLELSDEHRTLLHEPHFTIRPDESHLAKNRVAGLGEGHAEALARAIKHIEEMNTNPQPIPVLFGDPASPYLCCDPYFMDRLEDNPKAQEALEAFIAQMDGRINEVVLEAGSFCFIDNYKAVHGRKPFKARYDGRDRWIKRINVTRDLRKSRAARAASNSRVIY